MADLLVRLYDLPPPGPALEALGAAGIIVRRAAAAERSAVVEWVRAHGSPGWADECAAAFARLPLACFVAVEDDKLIGFACYEATYRAGAPGAARTRRRQGAPVGGAARDAR